MTLTHVLYAGTPYGMPSEGTPGTVQKFERDMFVKFHDQNYAPNQTLIAFAGDITPDEAFAAAEKYFGSWGAGAGAAVNHGRAGAGEGPAHLADRQAGRGANANPRGARGDQARGSRLHPVGRDEPHFRR